MLSALFTVLATALSLLVVDFIPGVDLANFPAALLAAVVIGLVNSTAKPVLSALSLPLNFVSFGLFSLVVNGLCFWLASVLTPGFAVRGLLAFIAGPVILTLVNTFILRYFAERRPALNLNTDAKTEV
ncbi:MAG: phage holin family protein [Leptolyngbyaceae cyanobacterium RM2_2_4]|nr:phage holin family protein [Leptolyngbyaceae cyanobacterium SM1_4_3]NJN90106.1 phage holin family protein [Leptolyngbyaceae cyanobacterium SL_5_14]NJO50326.1 phage holin family protein [Leptolyngbyaceae cyanobacterium RM2_2_4]